MHSFGNAIHGKVSDIVTVTLIFLGSRQTPSIVLVIFKYICNLEVRLELFGLSQTSCNFCFHIEFLAMLQKNYNCFQLKRHVANK